ncbi:MAG: acyltransferase family protein [Anaerolineae bacterium]|nr:acyltransferase family protein [Anaerolineae bacterium]
MLAGYFTPGSFDRKGAGAFLKDRLIRLGIPLLAFTFVLSPISNLGFYLMPASLTGLTGPPTWEAYPRMIGLGPLWFVAMLLLFSFGYVIWRLLRRNQTAAPAPEASAQESPVPGYVPIIIFALALAVVSYLFRMIVPLGQSVEVFADWLSFPTIAYLPQYLSFFILGMVASRHDWFRRLPASVGVVGFVVAMVAGVFAFPVALSGQLFSVEIAEPAGFVGNGHWQSALYALWDSIFAVGIVLAAITLFRRFFNARSRFGTFLSQQGYAVYVIHVPIIVFLAYAISSLELASLLKFIVASIIIVPVCFVVAYLLRKLPFVARVL